MTSVSPAAPPSVSPAPARPPVTATSVADIPFDRGLDYYNDRHGELQARPATTGLIRVNAKTAQAADDKIQAIQNRAAELEKSGAASRDASGSLHYTNAKTGETVSIEKTDKGATYTQTLVSSHHKWFTTTTVTTTEQFQTHGDEVNVAITDVKDKLLKVLIYQKDDGSTMTQSFNYKHSPEGFMYKVDDTWKLMK